jgi:hypothetical protein
MFKTFKIYSCTIFIFIFKHPFLHIKCAPFFLNIGNNCNTNNLKINGVEIGEIHVYNTFWHFQLNVFFTFKIIKFENVS